MSKEIKCTKLLLTGLVVAIVCAFAAGVHGQSSDSSREPGAAGEPYPLMPSIAPIGVRIGKYMDVQASARGHPSTPSRVIGYRIWEAVFI